MDYLRWILLVAGIFFVLILYLVGRKNHNHDNGYGYESDNADFDNSFNDEVDDWQDADEGVGEVRIVASRDDDYEDKYEREDESSLLDEIESDTADDVVGVDDAETNSADVIVLHILAKSPNRLAGDKINSAAQANGLKFGDMDIFHFIDNGQSVFSMTNMVEPGIFDPDTMHELKTPGLTLFMQKSALNNIDIFEDMLTCAYRMSEMLGAELCNRQRQPLTQTDAEQYRELATSFDG